jgi:hypothetical protein
MGRKPEAEAQNESVPMSVGYLIIRVGEWTMVMLGETVLSLLGVTLESDAMVYFMFICCMLIGCNMQFQGYTIHPIHASQHVLQGGQFSFNGFLYLLWATVWYATILVCVGTGAKVLTKKALYFEVYSGANWVLCGGLAAAFVSIMVFDALHQRSDSKPLGLFDCFTSNKKLGGGKAASSSCYGDKHISPSAVRIDILKVVTVVCHLVLAVADLKPHFTVVIIHKIQFSMLWSLICVFLIFSLDSSSCSYPNLE